MSFAPPHRMIRCFNTGADRIFGIVLFAGTVTPALTIFPALAAIIAGEVLRIRSWMYYVLAGGASLVAIPLLTRPRAPTTFSRFRPAPTCRSLLPQVSSAVSSIGCSRARGPND